MSWTEETRIDPTQRGVVARLRKSTPDQQTASQPADTLTTIAKAASDYLNPPAVKLTPAEYQVLLLCLSGKTAKEAAQVLCVAKRTIDFHIGRIYAKLGCCTRYECQKRVRKLGLIPVELLNELIGVTDATEQRHEDCNEPAISA